MTNVAVGFTASALASASDRFVFFFADIAKLWTLLRCSERADSTVILCQLCCCDAVLRSAERVADAIIFILQILTCLQAQVIENYLCPSCLGYPPSTYYQAETEQEQDQQILHAERILRKLRSAAAKFKLELQSDVDPSLEEEESEEINLDKPFPE